MGAVQAEEEEDGPLIMREAAATDAGLCLVATRHLQKREAVESGEKPILRWQPKAGKNTLEEAAEAAARAFLQVDSDCRHKISKLTPGSNCARHHAAARAGAVTALREIGRDGNELEPEEVDKVAHAAAIARVNGFQSLEDGLILFERCSRFNHSCAPNAEYGLREGDMMRVRTLRAIDKGEEVCISYLGVNGLVTTEVRKKILKERYLFDCSCELCSAALDELSALTCASCGRRALPGSACAACGAACSISAEAAAAIEALQVKAAVLEAECEAFCDSQASAHVAKVRGLLEKATQMLLQHHVVSVRLKLLLLNALLVSMQLEEAPIGEAWQLFEDVLTWFKEPWNLMGHCWGLYLAEPAVGLIKILSSARGRRSRARVARLQALLRGE